ncbi:MAG: GNAT family protein [Actinomycetia bacterium]|nr:GNAT family protein [Actinomycetes bacterium]
MRRTSARAMLNPCPPPPPRWGGAHPVSSNPPAPNPPSTHRLLLRPFRAEDIDVIVAYRNDPEVSALQDWDLPVEREYVVAQVAQTWSDIVPGASLNIGIDRAGELIGDLYVGLDEHSSPPEHGVAEIGFTVRTEHQGQGYAFEAATALIDDLIERLGCHRIVAQLSPANAASTRLLERLGFHCETHAPASFWWRGQWDDNLVYALTADDWRARTGRPWGNAPG